MPSPASFLVLGLGITGRSVLDFLLSLQDMTYRQSLVDSGLVNENNLPFVGDVHAFDTSWNAAENAKYIAIQEEYLTVNLHVSKPALAEIVYDWVIISPGLDPHQMWIQDLKTEHLMGDVGFLGHILASNLRVIGITGANGKSTVTTIVGELLQGASFNTVVGGNLGRPALRLLQDMHGDSSANLQSGPIVADNALPIMVLELSSFQLETCPRLVLQSAVVLNISEDHLDRHHSLECYAAIKNSIFNHVGTGTKLIPSDYGYQPEGMAAEQFCTFDESVSGFQENPYTIENGWLCHQQQRVMAVTDFALRNQIFCVNALAALGLVQEFQVPYAVIRQVLSGFKGLQHRCELVGTHGGVRWVNDSKGTNVGATLAALKAYGEEGGEGDDLACPHVVLLLGGQSKNQDFSPLIPLINDYVKLLFVFGEDKEKILSDLKQSNVHAIPHGISLKHNLSVEMLDSMHEVLIDIRRRLGVDIGVGDCVLLSPACASFDEFVHYVRRGEVFTEYVQELSDSSV